MLLLSRPHVARQCVLILLAFMKGAIASAVAGGDDAEAEAKRSNDVKLYRLNDQTGMMLGPISSAYGSLMQIATLRTLWV